MTDTLDYRYITEDVPYGLVTWSSIGDMLGVPNPTMKACIQIASVLLDRNFWMKA
jgi:opine dehydrogenase